MMEKQIIQECPKCHSLKTTKDVYGFRCLSCGCFFPSLRSYNEKKEVEVER